MARPSKKIKKKLKGKSKLVWKGNESVRRLLVPLSDIKIDPENARRHSERSLKALALALDEFGQQTPIVVDKNMVARKGNGTAMTAKDNLGWTHIAALMTDIEDDKVKLYSIVDNRTAEMSGWQAGLLAERIQKHYGQVAEEAWTAWWNDYELQPLLNADVSGLAARSDKDEKKDEPGTPPTLEPVRPTAEQRLTIDRAIAEVMSKREDVELTEGKCIELICLDWLAKLK